MQLQEIQGTSKKSGKAYTAYSIKIGLYETPLFFPTKLEAIYIKDYLKKQAHEDFKGDDLDVEED